MQEVRYDEAVAVRSVRQYSESKPLSDKTLLRPMALPGQFISQYSPQNMQCWTQGRTELKAGWEMIDTVEATSLRCVWCIIPTRMMFLMTERGLHRKAMSGSRIALSVDVCV